MLYLGTHNPAKARNMMAILNTVAGYIEVSDIFAFELDPPEEIGTLEAQRSELKSAYYFCQIKAPVISTDDGFYFTEPLPIDPLSVSNIDMGRVPATMFWKDLLAKYGVTGGVLKKAYSICTPDMNRSVSINIPFSVVVTDGHNNGMDNNIMNRFIAPEGFETPIAHMNETERSTFRMRYLNLPIKNLLQEVGLNG